MARVRPEVVVAAFQTGLVCSNKVVEDTGMAEMVMVVVDIVVAEVEGKSKYIYTFSK